MINILTIDILALTLNKCVEMVDVFALYLCILFVVIVSKEANYYKESIGN